MFSVHGEANILQLRSSPVLSNIFEGGQTGGAEIASIKEISRVRTSERRIHMNPEGGHEGGLPIRTRTVEIVDGSVYTDSEKSWADMQSFGREFCPEQATRI